MEQASPSSPARTACFRRCATRNTTCSKRAARDLKKPPSERSCYSPLEYFSVSQSCCSVCSFSTTESTSASVPNRHCGKVSSECCWHNRWLISELLTGTSKRD